MAVNKRWGKPYEDNREWVEYNEKLVRRGEFYLSLDFIEQGDQYLAQMNNGKRGSLIYTDKFRCYNGLITYGFRHMRIDHGKRFVNGKVYINGIEGFWSFAKESLMKYHSVNPKKFPLYLKELEFRYNNRHHDIYDAVVKSIFEYSLVASIQ